jgi:hypothetical protein
VPPLDRTLPNPRTEEFDIALILDIVLYEVINTNGKGAARFLAQPLFKQVRFGEVGLGYLYDPETETFTRPS